MASIDPPTQEKTNDFTEEVEEDCEEHVLIHFVHYYRLLLTFTV